MDLVFLNNAEEWALLKKAFPKTQFCLGRVVTNSGDLDVLVSMQKNSGFLACAVFERFDLKAISRARSLKLLVAIRPLDPKTLNAAVSCRMVDFVLSVASSSKRFFDLQSFSAAKQSGVSFLFSLDLFLSAGPLALSELVQNTVLAFSLAKKSKSKALFVSGAKTVSNVRSVPDLCFFSDWFRAGCPRA